MKTRICSMCGKNKSRKAHGLCNRCYKLKRDKETEVYKQRLRWDKRLKQTYNITLLEYDEILEAQGGCCAICGKTPIENDKRLFVDHDHETSKVRGMLCVNCNSGLGHFRDDPKFLAKAIEYLCDPPASKLFWFE